MQLDSEERIIAAALDQAALDASAAQERGLNFCVRARQGHNNDFPRVGSEGHDARLVDWGTFRGGCPNIHPGGVRDRGPGQGGHPAPPSKLIPPAASRRTTLSKRR